MRLRYTHQARIDIASIYNNISLHNPAAAQRVEDHIRAGIELLARFPGVGVPTDEENVRRMPVGRYPYTVFYRFDADQIEVLRVIHGSRVRDLNRLP